MHSRKKRASARFFLEWRARTISTRRRSPNLQHPPLFTVKSLCVTYVQAAIGRR